MPPSEAKPERERKRFVTPFPSKRLTDVSEVAEQLGRGLINVQPYPD